MKFPWLDNMVKTGSVSPAARDEIYTECYALLKMAIDVNSAEYKAFMSKAVPIASAGLLGTGMLLWSKFKDADEIVRTMEDITKNKASVLSHPELQDHQDVASARFDEVVKLAPTVARNKALMERLVKSRLHSGLTDDDVRSLSMMQTSYTPKAGFQKKLQEKTAARRGEHVADIVSIVKTATKGELGTEMLKALGKGLFFAAPVGVLSLGTGAVHTLAARRDRKELEKRHVESFNEALRMSDPEKEPLHENKERAREAFKTLVHFAPHAAADPQTARAFMNKLVSYDQGVDLSMAKDMAQIEKDMGAGRNVSPFLAGFGAGAKALGLDKVVGGTVESTMAPLKHEITRDVAEARGLDYHEKAYEPHHAGLFGD